VAELARRWLKALFAAAVAGVLVFALWPVEELPPLQTGWDKADHLAAFAALAMLGFAAWPERRLRVVAWLLVLGAAIELLQGLTGYRTMDWRDFVADGLGVVLGWGLRTAMLGKAAR